MTIPDETVDSEAPDADQALRLTLACSRFARLAARKAEVGIGSVSWRVAGLLEQHGELRISDVAALERVSRPTMTTIIRRLEESGLVARRADPTDSRSALVSLTEAGRTHLHTWWAATGEAAQELIAGLDADQRTTLNEAADLLSGILAAADADIPSRGGPH